MRRFNLALLITFAISACWELPAGDFTSPYYWSDLFLDKYADELVVGELEPGPTALDEPRVVLLITGVTISEQWFDPIVARLERDGFVPVVYEPPALLSGSLFQAAHDLAEVVAQVRDDSGQDKIDILAECTGGVIARYYIQTLGGNEFVSRMVTFVSPQQGVDKAPWAASIAGWPALDDLTPGSAFLTAVNSAPLPEDVPFTSIYTCTDEYIRPYQTSIIEGATNIGLCDGLVGHFETFFNPDIYLIMHAALTEPTGQEVDAAATPEVSDVPGGDGAPEPENDDDPELADAPEIGGGLFQTGSDFGTVPGADPAIEPLGPPSSRSLLEADEDAVESLGCNANGSPGSGLAFVAPFLVLLALRRRLAPSA